MCCIMPAITIFLPSHKASTSNSKASSRKASINIGCSPETRVAFPTKSFSPSSL